MSTFRHLKVGDKVRRSFSGQMETLMTVMKVTDDLLICAAKGTEHWSEEQWWTFDRETGIEEDLELGWGVKSGRIGSYLVEIEDEPEQS